MDCLRAEHLPPPGYAFVNRFLHADPGQWSDEFLDQRQAMADRNALDESLSKLADLLDRIERGGAPLPVIQAAEEAVTLNLTGLVVRIAEEVAVAVPEACGLESLREILPSSWSEDPIIGNVALWIRGEASSADAAIAISAPEFATKPGTCFRYTIALLAEISDVLKRGGIPRLQQYEGVGSTHETLYEKSLRRALKAADTLRSFRAIS